MEAFCRLHSVDAIASDIINAMVFLLEDEGQPIGTGTLDGCHVNRVFILPADWVYAVAKHPACPAQSKSPMIMRIRTSVGLLMAWVARQF